MTKGNRVAAAPVLAGHRIRWTLEQAYQQTQQRVRLDWLRFTLPLDAVVRTEHMPCPVMAELAEMDSHGRAVALAARIADATLDYTGALALSKSCASRVAEILDMFEVGQPEDRGMDYYAARCPLMHEGVAVGHCLAGSKSANQAGTVHVNLHGEACLYVSPAKWQRLRDFIAANGGWITRVDLAVDVFTGDEITEVVNAYVYGLFDVRGQRPKESQAGSWISGYSRTQYVGKRETGKMFRAYEKGDQLFGPEANDPWIRYELELRNNARVIDLDVMTRPADFFAGAYEFTEALLQRLQVRADPQAIPAGQKLRDATAEAAVTRVVRNAERACLPSLVSMWDFGGDLIADLVAKHRERVPNRLKGFSKEAIQQAFSKVAASFAPDSAPSSSGHER